MKKKKILSHGKKISEKENLKYSKEEMK